MTIEHETSSWSEQEPADVDRLLRCYAICADLETELQTLQQLGGHLRAWDGLQRSFRDVHDHLMVTKNMSADEHRGYLQLMAMPEPEKQSDGAASYADAMNLLTTVKGL